MSFQKIQTPFCIHDTVQYADVAGECAVSVILVQGKEVKESFEDRNRTAVVFRDSLQCAQIVRCALLGKARPKDISARVAPESDGVELSASYAVYAVYDFSAERFNGFNTDPSFFGITDQAPVPESVHGGCNVNTACFSLFLLMVVLG